MSESEILAELYSKRYDSIPYCRCAYLVSFAAHEVRVLSHRAAVAMGQRDRGAPSFRDD